MPTPPGNYDPTRELWGANTLVTASHPSFPGVNIYIAGGTGVSGAIPVVLQGGSTGGLGTVVDIASPLLNGAVWITGSVWVLNPSSGSTGGGGDVNITASIPLQVTASVPNLTASISNLPVTQSVSVQNWPAAVTQVTATISGVVAVSQTNIPTTQQVSISGVAVSGGRLPVDANISFSGSISPTPVEAYPNSLENIRYTRKKQLYDLAGNTTNYIGYAVQGTSPASASWTIQKIVYLQNGDLDNITWSGTGSVWNNRASEVYT